MPATIDQSSGVFATVNASKSPFVSRPAAADVAPTAANFVPLTEIGFLPKIGTELRDYAGTIGYEILTSLGRRYDRTWR